MSIRLPSPTWARVRRPSKLMNDGLARWGRIALGILFILSNPVHPVLQVRSYKPATPNRDRINRMNRMDGGERGTCT